MKSAAEVRRGRGACEGQVRIKCRSTRKYRERERRRRAGSYCLRRCSRHQLEIGRAEIARFVPLPLAWTASKSVSSTSSAVTRSPRGITPASRATCASDCTGTTTVPRDIPSCIGRDRWWCPWNFEANDKPCGLSNTSSRALAGRSPSATFRRWKSRICNFVLNLSSLEGGRQTLAASACL